MLSELIVKKMLLWTIPIFLLGAFGAALLLLRHTETVYRVTAQGALKAHIFQPSRVSEVRGAVLFFHGGGWYTGSRRQFVPFAKALARAGFVSVTVDYRVHGKHGVQITDSLNDAQYAVEWVLKQNAALGFEKDALALGGGSAGGHLAACIATQCSGRALASPLRALLLMNPVLDLTQASEQLGFSSGELMLIDSLDPGELVEMSPLFRLPEIQTNTLVVFGTDDPLYDAYRVPLERVSSDAIVLHTFPAAGHGFFNAKSVRKKVARLMLDHLNRNYPLVEGPA